MRTFAVVVVLVFLVTWVLAQNPPALKDKKTSQQKSGQKQTADKKKKAAQPETLQGFDLNPPSTETAQITGGSRGGEAGAVLLAPRKGVTYSTQPIFYWSEPKPARTTFVLLDREHNALSRAEAEGNSFRPDQPLTPGSQYFWTIEPAALFAEAPAEVAIVVLGGAQRKAVETDLAKVPAGDSYDSQLARARIFGHHKLWYDAIAAYTDLIAGHPEKPELYRERAQIYNAVVATKSLAPSDEAKAAQLEQAPKK